MSAVLRRVRAGADDGVTLAELLVTMMILSVVMAALAMLFVGSMRTTAATQGRLDETGDARIAVSAMGRSLRTAILPSQLYDASSTATAAFISADPRAISFYANIDNVNNTVGPTRVRYWVDASGSLWESKQVPNARAAGDTTFVYCTPGPGCTTVKQKVLARGVPTTGTIFTYYDELGAQMTGSTLTVAQMERVDAIDIAVTVQRPKTPGGGSTYNLRVALPNHDAVVKGED